MTARLSLAGGNFGRLTVISLDGVLGTTKRYSVWRCKCECGAETLVRGNQLTSGKTTSCGCARLDAATTHGATKWNGATTPEYRSWKAMKARCFNPKNARYCDYGARGISVCARWLDFTHFIEDMGEKPTPLHTIDRIDNSRNYEPGNVRWATPKEQAANRRQRRRAA